MSDEHLFGDESPVVRMRVWALGQMVWGAFLAGAGVAIVGGILFAVWAVGQMLPEESKQDTTNNRDAGTGKERAPNHLPQGPYPHADNRAFVSE